MTPQEKDPVNVDINLDAEPIGESPLDSPEAATGTAAEPAAPAPAEEPESAGLRALVDQLSTLQAEKDDLYQTLVRRQADFDNYRKRIERERQEDGRKANAQLVESLLPVLDAFERALSVEGDPSLAQYRVGFELIYRQLWDVLGRLGLEKIVARGKPFDPFFHQAVERVESAEHEDGTVIEDLQAGYKIRDRVLRPSMVRVSIRPPAAPEPPESLESPEPIVE